MKTTFKILFSLFLIGAINLSVFAETTDFNTVKNRVVAELMKSEVDDSEVELILLRMNNDGSFKDINYIDLSRIAGFPHRKHTSDLVTLAKAFKSKFSKYYKNKNVKQAINMGLKYWVENDYFGDNWHNNQISTPTNLVNLMLIIGDEMPKRSGRRSAAHNRSCTHECFGCQTQWRQNCNCRNSGKKPAFYWR
jgi:chondroitin AC lyase